MVTHLQEKEITKVDTKQVSIYPKLFLKEYTYIKKVIRNIINDLESSFDDSDE